MVEAHFNGYIILRLLYILMNTVSALGYCLSLKRSMPARLECLIIDGMNPSCYLFNTFVHIYLLSPFCLDNIIHHLKDKLPYPNAHILLYYIWLYSDSIPNNLYFYRFEINFHISHSFWYCIYSFSHVSYMSTSSLKRNSVTPVIFSSIL